MPWRLVWNPTLARTHETEACSVQWSTHSRSGRANALAMIFESELDKFKGLVSPGNLLISSWSVSSSPFLEAPGEKGLVVLYMGELVKGRGVWASSG